MKSAWFAMVATVLVAAGCGGDPQPGTPAADDPIYTLTIVSTGPDGLPHVTTRPISASEQRAAVAARSQLTAGGDRAAGSSAPSSSGLQETQSALNPTACGPNDMWMFDLPNLGGNEICFHGPVAALDLRTYCAFEGFNYGSMGQIISAYCAGFWSDYTRSFWAGNENGFFMPLGVRNDCSNIFGFTVFQREENYTGPSTFLGLSAGCL